MSMTATDLKAEIAQRYRDAKAIEDKYPDGLTPDVNHEDYEQVKTLLTELDAMEDQLGPLEDADERKRRILDNAKRWLTPGEPHRHPSDFDPREWPEYKSAGASFIDSTEYKSLRDSGAFNSPNNRPNMNVAMDGDLLAKALVYSGSAVAGSLVAPDRRAGLVDKLQRELSILDLIPSGQTDSDTIEYIREDSFTSAAASVAEATATTGTSGLKPESSMALSKQTSPVRTIAHWLAVTNRILSDAPMLRGLIDSRLLYFLRQKVEDLVIDGDGTGENFTGILRTAGILIQGVGSDNVPDAIFKARTQIMVTGLARPNGIVMHPNDWQAVRLMRENAATGTLGNYLYGPPSVAGPSTMWGYPVVEAIGEPENTALIGAFDIGAFLFDREQSQIRVGTIDDQFVRNMQTILAELRAAFIVFRPTAFAKVTGV